MIKNDLFFILGQHYPRSNSQAFVVSRHNVETERVHCAQSCGFVLNGQEVRTGHSKAVVSEAVVKALMFVSFMFVRLFFMFYVRLETYAGNTRSLMAF